ICSRLNENSLPPVDTTALRVPSPALPGGVTENSANIFSLGAFKSTGIDFGVTCQPAGTVRWTLPCTAEVEEAISTAMALALSAGKTNALLGRFANTGGVTASSS